MVTIKQVTTKKELKQFIRFINELYKDCENYCPVLENDEKSIFTDNPALEFSEFANFLAYRDGKIVGRICALVNNNANEFWNVKKVRFGWFDFIDDYEVSSALLDAAVEWGKAKGMTHLNGPVGFTDLDHQGLLLEGYEYLSPMVSLYNFPYYVEHFDRYGLKKEVDWIENRVFIPEQIPEKMVRVANIVMDRYKVKVAKVKSVKELKARFGTSYFDVINEAYKVLYNFQPLTEKQKTYYSEMYFGVLNFDFITLIVNEEDKIVGVGFGMPNISKAVKKCNGRMLPFGWFYLLKALKAKQIEAFDLMLIAVHPDYQNKGINSLFFYDQIPYFHKYGIKYAETTAILEDNTKNQSNWEYFDCITHKRRRAYIKAI